MKNIQYVLPFLLLTACGEPNQENTETKARTTTAISEQTCYHRFDGMNKQDSFLLSLEQDGNNISGTLAYYPHEKDKRLGTLTGSIHGDIIDAQWIYMQEGITDTIPVSFKINGDDILQRPNIYDPNTGKEIPDEKASYAIEYKQTVCTGKK